MNSLEKDMSSVLRISGISLVSILVLTLLAASPGSAWGGSQTLVEKKYQPPTAFADQIKEYQLGVTANNGTEWYGVFATARFIDVGWWTWAPFFLLGLPLIVLIPSDG